MRSYMKFALGISVITGLLLCLPAQAGINVNNGNFYVAYTDLFLPTAGLNIDVTRTYNSRSNYVKGFFGVGWSSEIEGYLTFDKKDVNYYEGGGGNVVKFTPSGRNTWVNGVFGPQKIHKSGKSWVLEAATGKNFVFDSKGTLQKVTDKNKNYLDLVYSNGRLSMLRDNLNNQIRITWKDFGKFPRITLLDSGNGKYRARYEYSPTGDLSQAIGADGVPYGYKYDDEHNMTRITYKDGSYKEMKYNKIRDWVTKFRDKDAITTSYDYISDNLDPENKFGTIVSRTKPGTKGRDVSRYWYEFRRRGDGTRYNYKAVTWIRGQVTETIFTECCGTPLVISQWQGDEPRSKDSPAKWTTAKRNKRSTFFEYYKDGLLKKKSTADGLVTFLTYDKKFNKVSSVSRNGRKVEYHYDPRGNLAWAFDNAEARRLDLTYDVNGRLTVVREARRVGSRTQKRDIFFRYNPEGRPIEIKEKGAGSEGIIRIAYNSDGEVTQILNGRGRAVASEQEVQTAQAVATTFQNLLEIVQPAGVSLTPEG